MTTNRRLALLVGSTIPIDSSMKPIPREIRDTNLELMNEALSSLGEYGFYWPAAEPGDPPLPAKVLRNPKRTQVIDLIFEVEPQENDLFLLYYFGHGFVGNGGELVLAYKETKISGDTNPFSLNSTISELISRGFSRLIVIVDCCHAGLSAPGLQIVAKKGQYYLMASTGMGRSYFDFHGGEFTRALASALSYSNVDALRDVKRNAVTFEKWFDVAKGTVESQTPTSDGRLGDEILRPYKAALSSGVNRLAPAKSVYSKIYILLDLIGSAVLSLEAIYKELRERDLYAFQIASIAEDGQVVPRFVLPEKVREYLDLLTDLGLTSRQKDEKKNETLWKLTVRGSRAVAKDGALFNTELIDALFRWLPEGVTADSINSILFELANKAVLPKVLYVEQSLIERDLPIMKRRSLRIALQLLAYAGVIQRATSDTFFPR